MKLLVTPPCLNRWFLFSLLLCSPFFISGCYFVGPKEEEKQKEWPKPKKKKRGNTAFISSDIQKEGDEEGGFLSPLRASCSELTLTGNKTDPSHGAIFISSEDLVIQQRLKDIQNKLKGHDFLILEAPLEPTLNKPSTVQDCLKSYQAKRAASFHVIGISDQRGKEALTSYSLYKTWILNSDHPLDDVLDSISKSLSLSPSHSAEDSEMD